MTIGEYEARAAGFLPPAARGERPQSMHPGRSGLPAALRCDDLRRGWLCGLMAFRRTVLGSGILRSDVFRSDKSCQSSPYGYNGRRVLSSPTDRASKCAANHRPPALLRR